MGTGRQRSSPRRTLFRPHAVFVRLPRHHLRAYGLRRFADRSGHQSRTTSLALILLARPTRSLSPARRRVRDSAGVSRCHRARTCVAMDCKRAGCRAFGHDDRRLSHGHASISRFDRTSEALGQSGRSRTAFYVRGPVGVSDTRTSTASQGKRLVAAMARLSRARTRVGISARSQCHMALRRLTLILRLGKGSVTGIRARNRVGRSR